MWEAPLPHFFYVQYLVSNGLYILLVGNCFLPISILLTAM